MSPYREAPRLGRSCPRCQGTLTKRPLGDARVEECPDCSGIFVDTELLTRIVDALDLGGEILASFPRGLAGTAQEPASGPMYLRCPHCSVLMNRRLFATGAKVIIDVCAEHGMWFDAAELRTVAAFAAGGGLERAASRDAAERARQAAERARRPAHEPILSMPSEEEQQIGLLTEIFRFFRG